MSIFLLSVCIALFVSFLCSLMEATVLSLTPSQVADVERRHPRLGALWRRMKARIDRPIAVILILNTTAHTIGATFAGASFDKLYGDQWMWAFSIGFTFVMLQFTELLPKSLGVRYNRTLAVIIARPLMLGMTLFRPVVSALHFLNRPFNGGAGDTPRNLDEITALAGVARLSREINPQQERIIAGAARLTGLFVRDIMLPRDQVSTVPVDATLPDALAAAHIDAHTRYPLVDDGRIVGYVNFKEIVAVLRTNPAEPSVRGIMRPLARIAPDAAVPEVLRQFTEQHVHIALVEDATGREVGLVTMEDIIEVLMGDIEDEFDRLPRHCHALAHGTWHAGGGLQVSALASAIGVALPSPQGSLADWLAARLPESPQPGRTHTEAGLTFMVRRLRRGRIFEVTVTRARSA